MRHWRMPAKNLYPSVKVMYVKRWITDVKFVSGAVVNVCIGIGKLFHMHPSGCQYVLHMMKTGECILLLYQRHR